MAPITHWGKAIKRSTGDAVRKEDEILRITNEGSKNVFTTDPKGLFSKIISNADEFFELCPPESEKYNIEEIARDVARDVLIVLVPEKTFVDIRSERCCAFAQKMREEYDKEMKKIEQWPPEEREHRIMILQRKYGAWRSCSPDVCKDCKLIWKTPLGCYVPDEGYGKIYICLDRIIAEYPPEKVDAIAATVILHEFGHAIMHNPKYPAYETVFDYWVEESLANKIALKYLAVASKLLGKPKPNFFDIAKNMVANQSDAYKLGLYLFDHNASDWHALKINKPNINQKIGDLWVDAVCEDDAKKDFTKIQSLFYSALIKPVVAPTIAATKKIHGHVYQINGIGQYSNREVIAEYIKLKLDQGCTFTHICKTMTALKGVGKMFISDVPTGVSCKPSQGPYSFVYKGITYYVTTQLRDSNPNHNFSIFKDYVNKTEKGILISNLI